MTASGLMRIPDEPSCSVQSSVAGDGHAVYEDGTAAARSAREFIIADLHDALEHVAQVAGNGDLLHRIADHPAFHPVAGGAHNLVLRSRLTRPGDDLQAMLRKLGRGLFVIELMGQGVNQVTGDYSRGAAGFWVDQGRIVHPVHEITIAGNLRDMLKGIVAVGADTYTAGSRTLGSVLVERMKLAGS